MYTNLLIIGAKTGILLLGGSITYYAASAYRRTGDESLRALAVGFGVVTFGSLLGGILDQTLGVSLGVGVAVNSVLTAAGFAFILYSLFIG
jgi:hypothetical protein